MESVRTTLTVHANFCCMQRDRTNRRRRSPRNACRWFHCLVYFKDGRVKVELALARGRRKADKRNAMAERDANAHAASDGPSGEGPNRLSHRVRA